MLNANSLGCSQYQQTNFKGKTLPKFSKNQMNDLLRTSDRMMGQDCVKIVRDDAELKEIALREASAGKFKFIKGIAEYLKNIVK